MKQSEISALSLEALRDKMAQLKSDYDRLKLTHAVTPVEKPMRLRVQRRTLARLATELRKRQLKAAD